jgi:hypothetical protein
MQMFFGCDVLSNSALIMVLLRSFINVAFYALADYLNRGLCHRSLGVVLPLGVSLAVKSRGGETYCKSSGW